MKFGEMKTHASFDDEGGVKEKEIKSDLFGVNSERFTITTEDEEIMKKFEDTESNALDKSVEGVEKSEKVTRFKKALKRLTVGVALVASTFGGIDKAQATDGGDFAKDASTYEQVVDMSESSDLDTDNGDALEQSATLQHESIEGLEQLQEENAKLETARDELEKNAMELASIDQDITFMLVDDLHLMLLNGHLSQEDYDKLLKKEEQRRIEVDAEWEVKLQQLKAEFEEGREAREKRAQEVARLAEQKTMADAQEYNKLLNYEVDQLLNIIINL